MQFSAFARARHYIPRFDAGLLVVYGCSVVSAIVLPLLLICFAMLTELLVTGGQIERGTWLAILFQGRATPLTSLQWLGLLLASIVLLVAVDTVVTYILDRMVQRLAGRTATWLRSEMRRQLFHLGGSDLMGSREASPVQLFTDRVETVREGLARWWRTVPREFFRLTLLVALALALQIWLALAAVLLAWLVWRLLTTLEARRKHQESLLSDRASHLMSMLVEGLRQVRLVRGYSLDDTPGQPFDETLLRYQKAAVERDQACSARGPLLQLVAVLGAALLVGLAGLNIFRDPPRIAVDEAVCLFAALVCACSPLSKLLRLPDVASRSDRAAVELFQYLDREPGVGQLPNAQLLDPPTKQLELQEVTLLDGAGHTLLEDVSLQIPVGSRAAFLSLDPRLPYAVAGLWPRFFDPQHGQVMYDHKDARYCTLTSLRSHLGLVLHEGLLFTGSVSENISCGDASYSEHQIAEAAKGARAYDFIQRLPLGFATTIGEHGMHLTTSQQFRIGLARAILREPAVLLLEEPEEDADPATNEILDEALAAAARNRTTIVFPSRLDTLRNADRVYLMHEGKLSAEGSHSELVQKSDLYRHLLYMRFNAFRDGKK